MDEEVQLISDDDGVVVVGPDEAVERFLRLNNLWDVSQGLDLRRLLGLGADVAQLASEVAANSGRWLKLTEESARLVAENGLMNSKVPGQQHLMIGVPGRTQKWLQAEQGTGSLLTNPAALSGISGMMAQAALRQAIADVVDYLAVIDLKVDDVLRKVDETMVSQLDGVRNAIAYVHEIRKETGEVDETSWSTVASAYQTIGTIESFALRQLNAVSAKLERTGAGSLAQATKHAERAVPEWLAVLAHCSQLQSAVDDLRLDRAFMESPETLTGYRAGVHAAQRKRRELIAHHTAELLAGVDAAVGTANGAMVWHRTDSLSVVDGANHVAVEVHDFHAPLQIPSESQSWDAIQLGRAADISSQAIQTAKDKAPEGGAMVATYGVLRIAATKLR